VPYKHTEPKANRPRIDTSLPPPICITTMPKYPTDCPNLIRQLRHIYMYNMQPITLASNFKLVSVTHTHPSSHPVVIIAHHVNRIRLPDVLTASSTALSAQYDKPEGSPHTNTEFLRVLQNPQALASLQPTRKGLRPTWPITLQLKLLISSNSCNANLVQHGDISCPVYLHIITG
jgi:hypothetical protein